MYDDNMEIIEHQKKLGKLKNTESIRNIPLNPRLKKLILKIKEERIIEYNKLGKVLNEDDYIFLNAKGEPYVPELLTKKMPTFIKKYGLEHMTVYRLRHSFATLCASEGMSPDVLHKIMGHSSYNTTRSYYIHVSEEWKQKEMLKIWSKQYTNDELMKLNNHNEKSLERINTLLN